MKITVNQLRRIIMEEVERVMEMEGERVTPDIQKFIDAANAGRMAKSPQHAEDALDVLLGAEVNPGDSGPTDDEYEAAGGLDPRHGAVSIIEFIIEDNESAGETLVPLQREFEDLLDSVKMLSLGVKKMDVARVNTRFGQIAKVLERLKSIVDENGYTIKLETEEEGYDEDEYYNGSPEDMMQESRRRTFGKLKEAEEAKDSKGPKGQGAEFVKSTAKKINSAIESEQDPGLRKALISIRSAMYDNSVVGKILKSAGITYNA